MSASHGVTINRRYLDLSGKVLGKKAFSAGLKSGDRMLVELTVQADRRMPHCLVVDMLPAGIELEDPSLSGSTLIDDIRVDDRLISQWQETYAILHREYRDDRFMAALDARGEQMVRIFYPARVVSPGTFRVPPPLVEDMYRPHIRGVGASLDLMQVTAP